MMISLLISLFLGFAANAPAQSVATPHDPALLNSLDSLKREITRRILSDGDKKGIRACDRGKAEFLKGCRADTAYARTDRELNDAKLHGADMNDPAVQALMERKFRAEKACDDKYNALPAGKRCLASEAKRRQALQKALKADKPYQSLLKKAEPGATLQGAEEL